MEHTSGHRPRYQVGSNPLRDMLVPGNFRMPGRVDSAAHAVAIAKIQEVARYAVELREHVDEIVKGDGFKGSHRSQQFLSYVVERALSGEFEDLRERSLGVALFGKRASYDTGEDAVVRVTASDVRRRLLQHYGKPGASSRFRIDLPSGSYIPEFRCVPPSVPVPVNAAAVPVQTPAGAESGTPSPASP